MYFVADELEAEEAVVPLYGLLDVWDIDADVVYDAVGSLYQN